MIIITERKTEKVVGYTSLFVQFNYRKEFIDFIHTLDGCNYSQRTKLWEIPIIFLSKVLDFFCQYDDIELNLNPCSKKVDVVDDSIDTSTYKIKPFDFQEDAIKYGISNDKWLLLDPPGLGKTAVITHIAEELLKRGEIEHCLVICSLNTLKENWIKEIEKHSNLTATILGQRITKTGKRVIGGIQERINHLLNPISETIVVTNIETIRSNDIVELIENGPNKFDMVVCDEIHKVKNSSSQQGSNFLKLIKHKKKIGATGTLLMNSPLDAYVPLSWIDVERSTASNFKYFYCRYSGSMFLGYQHVDMLKDMIADNSLRRPKELLKLPELRIIDEYVEMESKQEKLYKEIKAGIKDQVDKVKLTRANLLALVSRLRQATACPSILTTKDIPSAKIDRCCDLVEQVVSGGEKVLVFSTFKETVNVLAERLKDYKPLIGTGDVPDNVVSDNVDKFQTSNENKCFIATWQKCGTGITLTAATYVIFLDSAWTWADFEQHYSRAYRAGTTKPVTVYMLITKDTFDEKVWEIVNRKGAISDYIIDDEINEETFDILRKYIQEL